MSPSAGECDYIAGGVFTQPRPETATNTDAVTSVNPAEPGGIAAGAIKQDYGVWGF